MEIEFDHAKCVMEEGELWLCLRVKARSLSRRFADLMKQGERWIASLSPYRKKRSDHANRYCWKLCQLIAEKVGNTKKDVYRDAILSVGQFSLLDVNEDAYKSLMKHWGAKGDGWMIEKVDISPTPGKITVAMYYGSSTYDAREMSILLNYLIDEAKGLDIQTDTPEEVAKMMARWADAQADKGP